MCGFWTLVWLLNSRKKKEGEKTGTLLLSSTVTELVYSFLNSYVVIELQKEEETQKTK